MFATAHTAYGEDGRGASPQYSVSESYIIVDELLACILVGVGFIPTRIQRADMKSAPTGCHQVVEKDP